VVSPLVLCGMLWDERERAARFQPAMLYVGERLQALPSRCRLELGEGDQLALEVISLYTSITNEQIRLPLDRVQLPPMKQGAHEHAVQHQQRGCAENATDE